ncbi:MAG: alpha/beta fold hydrolase [Candidatus Velthaea sp.]
MTPFASASAAPYAQRAPAVAWRERRIGVSGQSIAVFETGSGAREAPVLFLVHGLGHWTQAAWNRLIPLLDAGLRIVAFDLPGFGASDRPDAKYDGAFFTAAAEAVVDAAGLPERFAVCGHSLGGAIAARYAAKHPHRVRALALVAPAGFAPSARIVYGLLGSTISRYVYFRVPSHRFVRRIMERAVVDPACIEAEMMERACSLSEDAAFRRAHAAVYGAGLNEFTRVGQLRTALRAYAGPTLIAWGLKDQYVPIRALDDVRGVYPQAEIEIFDRSAHLPMVEEPEKFATTLSALLESS